MLARSGAKVVVRMRVVEADEKAGAEEMMVVGYTPTYYQDLLVGEMQNNWRCLGPDAEAYRGRSCGRPIPGRFAYPCECKQPRCTCRKAFASPNDCSDIIIR